MTPTDHPTEDASTDATAEYAPRRDPSALRALAHPARLRILEELIDRGPATATELAERIDESPANCSWHLRQLARYAFIEEAAGGTGRQRPWQVVPENLSFAETGEPGSELARAEAAATDVLLDREVEALRAWRNSRHRQTDDWSASGFERQNRMWLTPTELDAFSNAFHELIDSYQNQHAERIDPARRPPGCRPIHAVAWAIPGPPETETPRG